MIAGSLLFVGSLQMLGDLIGLPTVKGIAAATMIAPAPRVFSSVRGLETYSTRFFLEWTDVAGDTHTLEITPEVAARLRGPYNRRNVYAAALAYGPALAVEPRARPMLRAVLEFGLLGDAPLLEELGVDPEEVLPPLRLRYEPLPGTDLGSLPQVLEIPLP